MANRSRSTPQQSGAQAASGAQASGEHPAAKSQSTGEIFTDPVSGYVKNLHMACKVVHTKFSVLGILKSKAYASSTGLSVALQKGEGSANKISGWLENESTGGGGAAKDYAPASSLLSPGPMEVAKKFPTIAMSASSTLPAFEAIKQMKGVGPFVGVVQLVYALWRDKKQDVYLAETAASVESLNKRLGVVITHLESLSAKADEFARVQKEKERAKNEKENANSWKAWGVWVSSWFQNTELTVSVRKEFRFM